MLRCPLALALVAALALTGVALGADSPIKLEVEGFAGEGQVIPAVPRTFAFLHVVLENTSDADLKGVLRAYRASSSASSTPALSIFYEAEVELPRHARRAQDLYYYVQDREPDGQVCVSFEPSEGEPPEPVFSLTKKATDAQVLILSRTGLSEQLEKLLDGLPLPSEARLLPTKATIANGGALPDHPAGYGPYSAVIFAEGELPPERAQALTEWVAGGGDLWIVASGGRSPLPAELQPLLPAEVLGTAQRQLSALAETQPLADPIPRGDQLVIIDRLHPHAGSFVVAGPKDEPLIVKGRYGAGWVTYFAYSLDAGPLRGWQGHRFLLRDQLRLPPEDLETLDHEPPVAPPLEEVQLNLTEALESLEPPSTWIVAPLLILYVALVGPLNFLLLRRARKLSLSQLSAGAIAIGFGVAFYALGVAYKGSEALITQVSVVDLAATPRGLSRVDGMTGYFSIGRGQTEAEGPAGALVGPLAGFKLSNREARLRREGGRVKLERVSLDTWALRRFRTVGVEDLGHLDAQLSLKEERVTGTLSNQTQFTLLDPVLIFPQHTVELNEIAPGDTVSIDHVPPVVARDRVRIPPLVKSMVKAARGYRPYYGMETAGIVASGPNRLSSPERRLFAALRRRLDRVPQLPGRVPALLLARAEVRKGGVDLAEGGRTALATTLVIREVEVDASASGPLRFSALPAQVAGVRGSRESSWVATGGHTGTLPILFGSSDAKLPNDVYWRWRLPAAPDAPLSLKSLKLSLQVDQDTTGLDKGEVKLEFYDFTKGTQGEWTSVGPIDKLSRTEGITTWPDSGTPGEAMSLRALHGPSGEVWFRLRNGSSYDLAFREISLDARVVGPTK